MDETDEAGPTGSSRAVSRRWLLGGAAAAIASGGVGALIGLAPDRSASKPRPNPPPAALVAAARAEQALIADLDATTGGAFAVRQVVTAARADHAEHLRVLQGLLARYDAVPGVSAPSSSPTASASASPSPMASSSPTASSSRAPAGRARTRAQLRAAEQQAAGAAARRAVAFGGSLGAVFASISAAETVHAELLR